MTPTKPDIIGVATLLLKQGGVRGQSDPYVLFNQNHVWAVSEALRDADACLAMIESGHGDMSPPERAKMTRLRIRSLPL